MLVVGLGFLALFSVISVLLGNEDARPGTDSRSNIALLTRYSR